MSCRLLLLLRRQKSPSGSWNVCVDHLLFRSRKTQPEMVSNLSWAGQLKAPAETKSALTKGSLYSASDAPAPPPPISPSAISKANHNEMLFITTSPIIANREAVLFIKGEPDSVGRLSAIQCVHTAPPPRVCQGTDKVPLLGF